MTSSSCRPQRNRWDLDWTSRILGRGATLGLTCFIALLFVLVRPVNAEPTGREFPQQAGSVYPIDSQSSSPVMANPDDRDPLESREPEVLVDERFASSPIPTWVKEWALNSFIALMVVIIGGSIGSFLNVVAYRWPRGLPLAGQGSQCPSCSHTLTFYENMPILGWFRIRGRCRYCDMPVSPRYPIVEIITAVVILAWFLSEELTGGLAIFAEQVRLQGEEPLNLTHWWMSTDLLMLALGRALLLITLLCAALLAWDNNRIPTGLSRVVVIVGITLGLMVRGFSPVPFQMPLPESIAELNWNEMLGFAPSPEPIGVGLQFVGLINLILGISVALMLARLLMLDPVDDPSSSSTADEIELAERSELDDVSQVIVICGVYLGWQSVLVITALGGVLAIVGSLVSRRMTQNARRARWVIGLAIAAAFWIIVWKPGLAMPFIPNASLPGWALMIWLLAISLTAALDRRLDRRSRQIDSARIEESAIYQTDDTLGSSWDPIQIQTEISEQHAVSITTEDDGDGSLIANQWPIKDRSNHIPIPQTTHHSMPITEESLMETTGLTSPLPPNDDGPNITADLEKPNKSIESSDRSEDFADTEASLANHNDPSKS